MPVMMIRPRTYSSTHVPAHTPPQRQLHHRQRGIALFEALVSILIFSFGVLGLIGLEARAINFGVDAEDRNRAALFANEVASSMWLAGTVTVSTTTLAAWQTSVADPTKTGLANGTVAITPVAGSTNSADITITWKPPSRAVSDAASRLTTRVILP
jgi:type IV pilus assembly protein PilV